MIKSGIGMQYNAKVTRIEFTHCMFYHTADCKIVALERLLLVMYKSIWRTLLLRCYNSSISSGG